MADREDARERDCVLAILRAVLPKVRIMHYYARSSTIESEANLMLPFFFFNSGCISVN